MKTRKLQVVLDVECPEEFSNTKVVKLVNKMLNIGMGDAAETNDTDMENKDSLAAVQLMIEMPRVAK